MSNLTVFQEVVFSMDDVSDEVDFYVSDEDEDVVFYQDTLEEVFQVIRDSEWFIQGNRTEGVLTIGQRLEVGREVNLVWKTITISGVEVDYEKDCILKVVSGGGGTFEITPQ